MISNPIPDGDHAGPEGRSEPPSLPSINITEILGNATSEGVSIDNVVILSEGGEEKCCLYVIGPDEYLVVGARIYSKMVCGEEVFDRLFSQYANESRYDS